MIENTPLASHAAPLTLDWRRRVGRVASRMFLAVGAAVLLIAAADPINSDLEAFDQITSQVVKSLNAIGFEEKMAVAATQPERSIAMRSAILQIEKSRQTIADFRASTPEMASIRRQFLASFDGTMTALMQMSAAYEKEDQEGMASAVRTLMLAQKQCADADAALKSLAQKTGHGLAKQ